MPSVQEILQRAGVVALLAQPVSGVRGWHAGAPGFLLHDRTRVVLVVHGQQQRLSGCSLRPPGSRQALDTLGDGLRGGLQRHRQHNLQRISTRQLRRHSG